MDGGMMLQEKIFDFFSSFGFSPKTIILFLGALPVTELRASIPIGILLLKQGVKATFFFSVLGNIVPIAPIYFLLDPVSKRFSKTKCMQDFFEWLYKRAKERSGIVEKYEALGLMIFVAIPLPGTGAWTGTMVASILRMRFIPTFISVASGVVIAAIIVTILTLIGKIIM
jgi:uncharacterized membrane protein